MSIVALARCWGASPGGALMHWAVTAAGWLIGVIVIVRSIRNPVRALDQTFAVSLRGNTLPRMVGVVVAVAHAIGIRVLVLQERKTFGEYERLSVVQGAVTQSFCRAPGRSAEGSWVRVQLRRRSI